MFTCFYALILIIIGLVLELSHLLNDDVELIRTGQARDMIFSIYMYGGSLMFFSYCYAVLLNSRMSRSILDGVRRATERTLKLDATLNSEGKPVLKRTATLSSESARKARK
ncbi:unnamed protein product, partial [Gongylonema pulchrum]|uniref:Uncharacterized protein n=1 Tax=Gongylonema pulchrum TaxID=637853 RepID=A0A183EUD4_9BILA